MSAEKSVAELKVTKRIDAERVGLVLKQNRDTMMSMDADKLAALAKQAEVDMGRCAEASATLRSVSGQLAEVMIMAMEVMGDRGIRVR